MAGWDRSQTLGGFLTWWVDQHPAVRVADDTIAQSTVDGYERSIRRHVVPHLGNIRLADLQPVHIVDWLADLARVGLGARGRQKALRALSAAQHGRAG